MNSNKEQVADAIDKLMFQDGELKSNDAVIIINLLTKLLKETEKDNSSDDESSDDEAAMYQYESQRPFTEAHQNRENEQIIRTNEMIHRLIDQSVGRNMDMAINRANLSDEAPVYPANAADEAYFASHNQVVLEGFSPVDSVRRIITIHQNP